MNRPINPMSEHLLTVEIYIDKLENYCDYLEKENTKLKEEIDFLIIEAVGEDI
jgi:hypothetical protein